MKRKNVAKIIALAVLLVFAIVMGKLLTKTSFGADNEESAILEGAFDKYINYQLEDGSTGTLVQYSIRTGIKYESDFFAIRNTELNVALNPIDGKYPYDVKVIAKSTKATNGKISDITEDYSYDSITGMLTIRTNNENEDGKPVYNTKPEESDRDEFVVISYYDTFTQDKEERELSCNVTYKAILFTEENREVIGQGGLNQKVTEDVGELTSVNTSVSDIYNGYMKSNIINGTAYDTEYTENNEIEISKKEAHQKIKVTEENTFINANDIYYKSTKILKDDIINVLGENGKVEILDTTNNILASIDNTTEFNEKGEYIVTYGEEVNNIIIKTSNIVNEGILHIENVKVLRSNISNIEDKDIVRKISVIGINEKEIEKKEELWQNTREININTNSLNIDNTKGEEKQFEISEEESYKNNKQNIIEIKDSISKVDFNLSNTEWTNEKQNDVIFDIYLDSSSEKYNLFKNPTIKIDLPKEVEKVILDESQIFYENGLILENTELVTNENGTFSIIASFKGEQTSYNENGLGLITNLKIPAEIILKKNISSKISKIKFEFKNERGNHFDIEQGNIEKEIKIKNFQEKNGKEENLITEITEVTEQKFQQEALANTPTKEEINGLQITVSPIKGDTNLKDNDIIYEGEFVKYNIEIKNTTDKDIDNIKVVGNIPEGMKYGELSSRFDSISEHEYKYNFDETLKEKEIDIGTIKSGESVTKYYEVQANNLLDGETQKTIETNIGVYIGDTEAYNYKIINIIEQSEVNVFLKSQVEGVEGEWSYLIVANVPDGKEATVKLNLDEFFYLNQEYIDTGKIYVNAYKTEEDANGKGETIKDYSVSYNETEVIINVKESGAFFIGVQESNRLDLLDRAVNGKVELKATASVTVDGITYRSNENRIDYNIEDISIAMSSDREGEEINYGEEVNYRISITNTGKKQITSSESTGEADGINVNVTDYLPSNVTPISMTYDYYELITESTQNEELGTIKKIKGFSDKQQVVEDINVKTDQDGNNLANIDLNLWVPANETINIDIKTTAGYVYEKTEIKNSAIVKYMIEGNFEKVEKTKTSNEVKHIIVPYIDDEQPSDPDNPNNPDNPNPEDPDNPDVPIDPNAKYSISGVAWNDVNGDGQRQSGEDFIAGIKVMLVNLADSSNVKSQITTNNEGEYTFQDLEESNYIVVFRYDTSLYTITDYRKGGVAENVNSDAMEQNIIIDGERVDVGVTNEINLNKNESNIDIGLIGKDDYDLKLDKYITDVTVTTRNGTKQYSYDNTKLGRVEIRAKELGGAKVLVKYKIVVTNEGKTSTTVNEIYDYLPDGLEFSESGNPSWSSENGVLINRSLMNQVIAAGESKEVTLTLSKTMGEEDTGTFINGAEIGSVEIGITGIEDTDSTPGNGNKSEDDYSEAELIIGVSTGLGVYISIGLILALIISLTLLGIKFKFKIKKLSKLGMSVILFILIGIVSSGNVFAECFEFIGNHTFTGGPAGIAYCSNNSWVAAGATWYDYCSHSICSYSVSKVSSYTEYGATEQLSESVEFNKLNNERIPARKIGNNYVLGPFKTWSNSEEAYTAVIYSKSGAIINGWAFCDENGRGMASVSGPGNVDFYISISASSYEQNGVSRITATQKKLTHYRRLKWIHEKRWYVYTGVSVCQQNQDHFGWADGPRPHQGTYTPYFDYDYEYEYFDDYTYKTIEWTDFNTNIDLYKVDADDHTVLIDIEGVFEKTDGTYREEFKTENGYYHFDNLVPGTYKITETSNDNYGYEKNEGIYVDVYGEGGRVAIKYMDNIKYTGNIKIIKKDKDTGDPMSDIGFKLYKEDEGYVIGINASGGPIRQARGSVQFHNMEYTQDPSQATEFITGDDGEMNIYNIRIGTYRVEEVSVNIPIYGYDLDEEYVYWSSNLGSGEHELIGRVEVIRRKSYYTTAKGGGAYPTSTPDSEFDTITFENRRKWVKLSGKVWEDMIDAKDSTRNYALDEGGADKLVANVTVRLKDKSGSIVPFKTSEDTEATVTQIDTDSNGAYTMVDVLIDEIPNYYIEFSYNGMSFTSVPVLDSPSLDSDNYNGTRAIESEAERTEFNRKYSEITHSGSTGPIGESRDDGGSKTYNLNYHENEKYELEDGTIIDQIKSTLNYGEGSNSYGYEDAKFPVNHIDEQYMITASTKEAFTQKGYSGYLSDMKTPEEIRTQDNGAGQYHGVEEITNMNLGIREREQPDLALVEDIEQVQIDLNGYTHTYNYNQRFENQEEYGDGFDIGVKFGNKYGKQEYTQAIYPSDVVYNQGHENALGIYVRYKIALRNESTTLYSRVNEVINHYDANYEIPQDDIVVTAVVDEAGVGLQYTEEGGSGAFKKVTIQANQDLAPQETKYIYITYRLTNDAVNQLLDGIAPIESVTEIGSYSTYENGFSIHYAGVDKDSRPGSAEPGNEETYEDDTDSAPSFLLEVQELRELKGTVWEDEAVQELLNISQEEIDAGKRKERIGNGEYEDSENVLQDVKVELLVLSYEEDSEIDLANASLLSGGNVQDIPQATLYTDNWQTDGTPAETMTGTDGSYTFSGVIPSNYVIRYTYGNGSVIYDSNGNSLGNVEAEKYKSTIYRNGEEPNSNYWYREETGENPNAKRLSDAKDEIGIKQNNERVNIVDERTSQDDITYGTAKEEQEDKKLVEIEANTSIFDIKLDYDINLDNISKYGVKLEFVFDNIDLGIIRRPIQNVDVRKEIAFVEVTLANGQTVISGDPRTEDIQYLKFMPDGRVHIELDDELIQGATLKIEYAITVDNTKAEIDYNDKNYYYYGTIPGGNVGWKLATVTRLFDYISNGLEFDATDSVNTGVWTDIKSEITQTMVDNGLLSQEAYDKIKTYNRVLATEAFASMAPNEERTIKLKATKLLANTSDDFSFDNEVEVNTLKGRKMEYLPDGSDPNVEDKYEYVYATPGNYEPGTGPKVESDDDGVVLVITGPTGEDKNYLPYILLGISSFIILGTGIIFIKKKVL